MFIIRNPFQAIPIKLRKYRRHDPNVTRDGSSIGLRLGQRW